MRILDSKAAMPSKQAMTRKDTVRLDSLSSKLTKRQSAVLTSSTADTVPEVPALPSKSGLEAKAASNMLFGDDASANTTEGAVDDDSDYSDISVHSGFANLITMTKTTAKKAVNVIQISRSTSMKITKCRAKTVQIKKASSKSLDKTSPRSFSDSMSLTARRGSAPSLPSSSPRTPALCSPASDNWPYPCTSPPAGYRSRSASCPASPTFYFSRGSSNHSFNPADWSPPRAPSPPPAPRPPPAPPAPSPPPAPGMRTRRARPGPVTAVKGLSQLNLPASPPKNPFPHFPLRAPNSSPPSSPPHPPKLTTKKSRNPLAKIFHRRRSSTPSPTPTPRPVISAPTQVHVGTGFSHAAMHAIEDGAEELALDARDARDYGKFVPADQWMADFTVEGKGAPKKISSREAKWRSADLKSMDRRRPHPLRSAEM